MAEFNAKRVNCRARPSSMRDMRGDRVGVQCGPPRLPLLDPRRKKKTRYKGQQESSGGRRDGSLRCSRSNQRAPCFRLSAVHVLLPLPRWIPSDWSIDWFPRAIDPTFTYAENSAQSSRQRLSSQFPSREIYPFRQKPLLPRESLSSVAVSFFSSSPSSSFSSPFTSLSVVVVAVVVVVILLFELSRSILSIVAAAGEARWKQ